MKKRDFSKDNLQSSLHMLFEDIDNYCNFLSSSVSDDDTSIYNFVVGVTMFCLLRVGVLLDRELSDPDFVLDLYYKFLEDKRYEKSIFNHGKIKGFSQRT